MYIFIYIYIYIYIRMWVTCLIHLGTIHHLEIMLNINHHASPKPWDFRRFGDLSLLFHTQFVVFAPSGACCSFSCTGQGTNYYMGPIHPRDKKPVGHLAGFGDLKWMDFHPPIFVMFKGNTLSKPCLRWGGRVDIFCWWLEMSSSLRDLELRSKRQRVQRSGQGTTTATCRIFLDKVDDMYNLCV